MYRKVKGLKLWETNKLAIFLRPYLGKLLRKTIVYTRRARQVYLKFTNTLGYLNSDGRRIQKARRHADEKRWSAAKREYEKLLHKSERKELRVEFKNELKLQISLIDRILNVEDYRKKILNYQKVVEKKPPKVAVFTAVSGGYDSVKLPAELNADFDYIIFTDSSVYSSGIYKVRPLPYFHEDSTRMARYVKTHPHQLLSDYDYAIWIDANIMILEDIESLFREFVTSGKPVGAIRHPLRDSIYEETRECIKRNKESAHLIDEQEAHYRELGFDCTDLIESNIMMIDLKSDKIPDFYATWWSEIDRYTKRDQLSINYALSVNQIDWHRIMDRPYNARNHKAFALMPHHVRPTSIHALENLLNTQKTSPETGKSFYETRDDILKSDVVKDKKIDIIYCVHNALDDVRLCLDSVAKHHHSNERLIIVDDGSGPETAKFLREFSKKYKSWTRLIRNPKGSGYTKAANQGLRASETADFVILLNSDTIVTRDWSRKLAYAVFSTPGGGIVGPLSSAASHQSIPSIRSKDNQTAVNPLPDGLTPDKLNDYCEKWSRANRYVYTSLVHGFCFGITREVLNKVGLFDEVSFPTGYGEENDFCFRAIDAGFVLLIATNTYIYHAKSKSYPDKKRIKYMKAGNLKLRELRGAERIRRNILSLHQDPILEEIRSNAQKIYEEYSG